MPYNSKGDWVDREFKEYTQTTKDGRKVKVRAHKVTDDTDGEIMTAGHVSREVRKGDWIIATDSPDVYEVQDEDAFQDFAKSNPDKEPDTDSDDDEETTPRNVTPDNKRSTISGVRGGASNRK